MKILVTGCAGFIGSHVAQKLCERGDEVVGIDNLNDYYDPQFKENNLKEINCKSFTFYKGDICDTALLEKIFAEHKIDRICHLAARAGVRPSIEQPVLYEQVNIQGTLNLLNCTHVHKVKNFVLASTSSAYGTTKNIPFMETDASGLPLSPYAATKRAAELLAYTYHHNFGIKVTALRFFTVYGPRGRPDMAPYLFTKKIVDGDTITRFGDGTTQRDYTYVEDIADGVIAALDKELDFEIINLGNSDTIELNEFISVIEEVTGKKAIIEEKPVPKADMLKTFADISKAKELLGYNPQTDIRSGMKKFFAWYQENRQ